MEVRYTVVLGSTQRAAIKQARLDSSLPQAVRVTLIQPFLGGVYPTAVVYGFNSSHRQPVCRDTPSSTHAPLSSLFAGGGVRTLPCHKKEPGV